jgi:hypothetical protein
MRPDWIMRVTGGVAWDHSVQMISSGLAGGQDVCGSGLAGRARLFREGR